MQERGEQVERILEKDVNGAAQGVSIWVLSAEAGDRGPSRHPEWVLRIVITASGEASR